MSPIEGEEGVVRDSCRQIAVLCVMLGVPLALYAQGSAPETAPPLFPGGGLLSYNSVFTTRGFLPGISGGIPATARPTFSREDDFNFTWGFYPNFDLTVLIPIVTNNFDSAGTRAVGGTGLGDAVVLVK